MIGRKERKPLITSPEMSKKPREESSPSKATLLLKSQTQDYINTLRTKKQNYSTSLDLYHACYENQLPQKCLKHLNFITLYCEDVQKLLCVNCLYGSTTHKNHKVVPSNLAIPAISADNEENLKYLDEEYENVREAESKIKENRRILESEKQIILKQIDNQFTELYKMLQYKHHQLKEKATMNFAKAVEENQYSTREVGWWKDQIHQTRSHFPRQGRGEDAELYKHLVLQLMLKERLETEKLTYQISPEEMEDEFLTEVKELKEAVKRRVEDKEVQPRDSRRLRLF